MPMIMWQMTCQALRLDAGEENASHSNNVNRLLVSCVVDRRCREGTGRTRCQKKDGCVGGKCENLCKIWGLNDA